VKPVPQTVGDFIGLFKEKLGRIYDPKEAESICSMVMEDVLKLRGRMEISQSRSVQLSPDQKEKLLNMLDRLLSSEPVQYVLGIAAFYGLTFRVDKNVLIPRPETEELVDLIIKENAKSDPVVLDIGTGSGCIAITLKKNIKGAIVYALDVSEMALNMARENARIHGTAIKFVKADFLKGEVHLPVSPDIIVSNPPYVLHSEKEQMHSNVVDFEPHTALFVNSDEPLIFYETISEYALKHLAPGGKLYFEINERYGDRLQQLMKAKGFKNIRLRRDLNEKDRIIIAF
jgi:release factor glutamine methyltransferase